MTAAERKQLPVGDEHSYGLINNPSVMITLRSLTENLETGDKLAWVAEKSMGEAEQVHPKEVMDVHHESNIIRVTAKGIKEGDYYYTVDSNNKSKAYVGHPSDDNPEFRGSVAFAHRTESDGLVPVKPRTYDTQ
jgi:hypothetical protein